ncbi:hypothetical protein EJ04DRAFT_516653 [Polyplosphaeria fusca]|uniref:Uncharacterized protein n=1 Tax=Polyplosphaeria fusca TaxID=682080 RepID=A0A9P4UWY8_9PLEO|nr:hypothetical protein EJ04DRAFT_516653 [Polyplosphaeria fusca]
MNKYGRYRQGAPHATYPPLNMTDHSPLIFYDISSPKQPRSYAPNPSKGGLTLGFKRVPFKTTWVDLLAISEAESLTSNSNPSDLLD